MNNDGRKTCSHAERSIKLWLDRNDIRKHGVVTVHVGNVPSEKFEPKNLAEVLTDCAALPRCELWQVHRASRSALKIAETHKVESGRW